MNKEEKERDKRRKQRINKFLIEVMLPFVNEYADVIDSMDVEKDIELFNKVHDLDYPKEIENKKTRI